MHLEVLVEDRSGQISLEILLGELLGTNGETHTYTTHTYGGIGAIPKNLHREPDRKKRVLLTQLPRLLRGYGRAFHRYGPTYQAAVVVVCDLDQRDFASFLEELNDILKSCDDPPPTIFSIAIEEGEAWLLGDMEAVKAAYPDAKVAILDTYVQDSNCGTWELLADAVHPGGHKRLKELGYPHIGIAKCEWAENISPQIDVEINKSPSFQKLRSDLEELVKAPH